MKRGQDSHRPGRRGFVKTCVGIMALGLHKRARTGQFKAVHRYRPARLVDSHDRPFRAGDLETGVAYVFHYPYVATPCFLVNLGIGVAPAGKLETESGQQYAWPGGVGPERSIVAFSAICAHKMTHPARSVSFINYRHDTVGYTDSNEQPASGDHLIYCCSEQSVYDATDGARVLGGPATQPLAAIGLAYDQRDDSLTATSTYGGEMFEQFFAKFTSRLQLEYRVTAVNTGVGPATVVHHSDEFSGSRVLC